MMNAAGVIARHVPHVIMIVIVVTIAEKDMKIIVEMIDSIGTEIDVTEISGLGNSMYEAA
ncbi:hypothetical protein [Anaerostipes faecalis]|uniref:hypothetical protein n=1 Tax=Anaerostipes faecalis TaxID=2738446 RepID=UPI001C1DF26E|nr:hypothetical protein [Anaerostipes faecalis]